MRGLQKSLLIGLLVAVISTGLAAVVGAVAGYFGGWVDRMLMWIVDLLLVIPSFLIIAIISGNLQGASWLILVLLIAIFAWMITARIIRGMTLSLREREFVQAARYSGVSSAGIIFRHLIPNMSSLLIIDATIAVATAILAESGLSYFGFGVKPPDVSLGTLIAEGTRSAFTFPWLFMFAGGLLVLTTLAVSVFGDGLRDALDPASKRSRRQAVTVQEERAEGDGGPDRSAARGARPDRRVRRRRRRGPGGPRAELHARPRARCSASSASRARASRCPRWPSWACCRTRPG